MALPSFDHTGRGGDRKKRESEQQEENNIVSTSKHVKGLEGLVFEGLVGLVAERLEMLFD